MKEEEKRLKEEKDVSICSLKSYITHDVQFCNYSVEGCFCLKMPVCVTCTKFI